MTTEFLFYPTYWEPRSLYNLISRMGFGIEDVLFVVGVGLVTVSSYPVVSGRRILRESPGPARAMIGRAGLLLAAAALK